MQLELFRSLFPRWNFFDKVTYRWELDVKVPGGKDWTGLEFNAHRNFGGLFINPQVTLMHAEMSLLETFANDIQGLTDAEGKVDSSRVQSLTTFKMVRSLVVHRLKAGVNDSMQFRLSAVAGEEKVVIYVSDVLRAE